MKYFLDFPREVGVPNRIVIKNKEEFLTFINKNIKHNNIYTTVYSFSEMNCTKPIYSSAKIDKIFFDLDGDECFTDILKMHEHFINENIMHTINFSGRGFHLYVFVKNGTKNSVTGFQKYIINKLNVNVDKQTIGDIARLARIPNTFNFRGNRFCIPVTKEMLQNGFDFIKEKAKKQHTTFQVFGKNKLDITEYETNNDEYEIDNNVNEFEVAETCNINVVDIPDFIKMLLNKHKLKWEKNQTAWRERYTIILFFKEMGYRYQEILNILKNNMTVEEFKHCIVIEKQLYHVFKRKDLFFPKIQTLLEQGFKLNDTDKHIVDNIYFNI